MSESLETYVAAVKAEQWLQSALLSLARAQECFSEMPAGKVQEQKALEATIDELDTIMNEAIIAARDIVQKTEQAALTPPWCVPSG